MGASRPARAVPTRRLWWWLGGVGVVALVVAVVAVAVGWGAPNPVAPGPAGPSASSTGTSAPAPTSASASPTASPSASPSGTPSVTPTPAPSRAVQKEAYCKAFRQIRAGSVSTGSGDGPLDYDALAERFASLITVYSRAARAAPSSLDHEYAVVLAYLKDMRKAVVTRDLDGIKAMISNLDLLNQSMAAIEEQSERICG